MKKAYVTNGKPKYEFSAWSVLSFGYFSQYFQFDKYNTFYYQTWYFLFWKLSKTTYLKDKY